MSGASEILPPVSLIAEAAQEVSRMVSDLEGRAVDPAPLLEVVKLQANVLGQVADRLALLDAAARALLEARDQELSAAGWPALSSAMDRKFRALDQLRAAVGMEPQTLPAEGPVAMAPPVRSCSICGESYAPPNTSCGCP